MAEQPTPEQSAQRHPDPTVQAIRDALAGKAPATPGPKASYDPRKPGLRASSRREVRS